jgi:DNA-binding NarL/FixJ family response regulator
LLLLMGAPVVVPLLKLAIMQHVHPVFARRMLHVFRHGNDEAHPAVPLGVSPAVLHDPHALTPREREVLHLLAAGMTNDAIAAQLVVSPATVKKHINHLFSKLGAKNRMQALLRARERDVV